METFAARLKTALEKTLGVRAPAVVVGSDTYGDPYSGHTTEHTLSLDLTRPDNHKPLAVRFRFSEHDLSGQCDLWTAEISGALASERALFLDLFHPRQRTGAWGSNATRRFTFNGSATPF